jgi:hypothetical protein
MRCTVFATRCGMTAEIFIILYCIHGYLEITAWEPMMDSDTRDLTSS